MKYLLWQSGMWQTTAGFAGDDIHTALDHLIRLAGPMPDEAKKQARAALETPGGPLAGWQFPHNGWKLLAVKASV